MKTAKAAALLAVILLLSISFGACSANNAAAETEASQQTPEATSTPDVTVELDTSEDKGAGKSNAGSMSVDEQRYASVLDLYYQALYDIRRVQPIGIATSMWWSAAWQNVL
ncbi:MAG: hypothetical protein ACLSHG_03880 [Oscillospiraceae bacterium]